MFKFLTDRVLMAPDDGGAGSSGEVDEATITPTEGLDSENGGTPPKEGVAEEEVSSEPSTYEIEGEVFTEQDLLTAVKASQDRASWEKTLHEKGENLNAIARSLEQARQGVMSPQPGQPHVPAAPAGNVVPTGDEFRDLLLERPEEAMSMMNTIIQDTVKSAINGNESRRVAENHFLGNHENFNEVISSPGFQQFKSGLPRDNEGNPVYNDVNAFYAYEHKEAQAKITAAEKAGFLKGEEAVRNNNDAKSRIKIMRGGGVPPAQAKSVDVRNMDTEEFLEAATASLMKMRTPD